MHSGTVGMLHISRTLTMGKLIYLLSQGYVYITRVFLGVSFHLEDCSVFSNFVITLICNHMQYAIY